MNRNLEEDYDGRNKENSRMISKKRKRTVNAFVRTISSPIQNGYVVIS